MYGLYLPLQDILALINAIMNNLAGFYWIFPSLPSFFPSYIAVDLKNTFHDERHWEHFLFCKDENHHLYSPRTSVNNIGHIEAQEKKKEL